MAQPAQQLSGPEDAIVEPGLCGYPVTAQNASNSAIASRARAAD